MLSSIFRRPEQRAQATTWGLWPGEMTQVVGGVSVTEQTSMQLLTVYGSVRLISDSIATLPLDVYRRTGDDTKVEVAKPQWLQQPTTNLDFTAWVSQVLSSLLLHGNAYVVVLRNEVGAIVELVPLDPSKVRVTRDRGRLAYIVNGQRIDAEMLHIKGLMLPGSDVGLSPVEYARQSIGLGLAAVKFGTGYFEGEGNMPGVIEMPGSAQSDTLKAIADQWRRRRREGGRGLPGVLQEGATWKPTGVTNEQAQFLATRKFTSAEIAGQMFMIDPTELGIGIEGSSLTYANLEQRNTRFVRVTLLPWIVRLEKALSDLLAQPRYVKFNLNGLLRGDLQTRYAAYSVGIGAGFLKPNEARDWEDLPPMDDTPDAPDMPDDNNDDDEAMRSVMFAQQMRSIVSESRGPETHIHLPDSLQVEMRQEPIVIPAPIVNIPPAQVTVNVEPTPVTVNVPPADVTVNVPTQAPPIVYVQPPDSGDESITFTRDPSGRIVGAKKVTN
ncbi:MAG: phage portal protein [Ilumatobacteraceae bacterium]